MGGSYTRAHCTLLGHSSWGSVPYICTASDPRPRHFIISIHGRKKATLNSWMEDKPTKHWFKYSQVHHTAVNISTVPAENFREDSLSESAVCTLRRAVPAHAMQQRLENVLDHSCSTFIGGLDSFKRSHWLGPIWSMTGPSTWTKQSIF
jgi:hypothetical protein